MTLSPEPREDTGLGAIAVRRLDLTGRERHLRAAIQAMDRVAAAFARAARRSMPFLVRYGSSVTTGAVEVVTGPDADRMAGDAPTSQVGVASRDGLVRGFVGLNSEAISLVLEGALGGRGAFWRSSLGADLTPAQKALVSRIGRSLAADFATAIHDEVGLTLEPQTEPLPPPNEKAAGDMLRVTCSIQGLPVAAALTLAVSAQAVEAAAKQAADDPSPQGDPRIAEAVRDVEVSVVAELGRVSLGIERVLSLQPGDVIRLSTAADDPIAVRVAGVKKFDAAPLVSRGQLAVEVKSRHED